LDFRRDGVHEFASVLIFAAASMQQVLFGVQCSVFSVPNHCHPE
jgi:hypothetical protein